MAQIQYDILYIIAEKLFGLMAEVKPSEEESIAKFMVIF